MRNFLVHNKISIIVLGIVFALPPLFVHQAHADVLTPGTITTCGELAAPGTYTLSNSVSTTTGGTCFRITSNDVVIDGASLYTVDGKIVGDGVGETDTGFNFTIQNVTVTATTSSNGGSVVTAAAYAGSGGSVTAINVTAPAVTANGGANSVQGSWVGGADLYNSKTGSGGIITITNSNVPLIVANGGNINTDSIAVGVGGTIIVDNSLVTIVRANGGSGVTGWNSTYSGRAGTITITHFIGNANVSKTIEARAGTGGNFNLARRGGTISISATDLDLASTSIDVSGTILGESGSVNDDYYGKNAFYGTTTLNYGTINTANLGISNSILILNGPGNLPGNMGVFAGGYLSLDRISGGVINSSSDCNIYFPGSYTLGADINGDCHINADGVSIDGLGHTINGNVIGDGFNPGSDGYNYSLQNLTVTGSTTANSSYSYAWLFYGGRGGSITLTNATTSLVQAKKVDAVDARAKCAGTVSLINSTSTVIDVDGGVNGNWWQWYLGGDGSCAGTVNLLNSYAPVIHGNGGNGYYGQGIGGTVNATSSVIGSIQMNSGVGSNCGGYANSGGTVRLNYSVANTIDANGSYYDCQSAGSGGTVSLDYSSVNRISANGGQSNQNYGGNGGTVTINNSTTTLIYAKGGTGPTGGGGGAVTFNAPNLNLASTTVYTTGYSSNNGTINLNFVTNLLTDVKTFFFNVSGLTVNGASYGPWNGVFNNIPTSGTYYFNDQIAGGGNDGDWHNVNNWWSDVGTTVHANSFPGPFANVFIHTNVSQNTGSAIKVASVVFENAADSVDMDTLYGITFNGTSSSTATLTGTSTFNNTSINNGTVTGVGVFNDTSSNHSSVVGTAIFNNSSTNTGTVTGKAIFNGSNINTGTVEGTSEFNNSSSNNGSITGVNTFSGNAQNTGTSTGRTTFKGDHSENPGAIAPLLFGTAHGPVTDSGWYSISVSPDANHLIAGAYQPDSNSTPLYVSHDGGLTWTGVSNTIPQYHSFVSVTLSADGIKMVAVDRAYWYGNNYIWFSTDSGQTWAPADGTNSTTDTRAKRWQKVLSSADGTKIFALDGDDTNGATGGIWLSTDFGHTWTKTSAPTGISWYYLTMTSDAQYLAAGNYTDAQIWTSDDYGVTWVPHADPNGDGNIDGLVYSADGSNLVTTGCYGLIYTSSDRGNTWVPRTSDPDACYGYITSSADGRVLATIDWNINQMWVSQDYGVSWQPLIGPPDIQPVNDEMWWEDVAMSADGKKLFAVSDDRIYSFDMATRGTAIREYSQDADVGTRDFTVGSNNWIIQAVGSVVDLSHAIYDTTINFFQALLGGSFITNLSINGGAPLTPTIAITAPVAGTVTKWSPVVDWGTSTKCEYSYDNFVDDSHGTDCSKNGSDITRPASGTHTLYVRGTNASSSLTSLAVTFTYDNTAPTWTTCGADLLDEPRPYYYLIGNVTGNCRATVNTELRGSATTTDNNTGYTVTGNIIATTTTNGLTITLKNITVTGSVDVSGARNTTGTGYTGGTITIATSTTGAVRALGGAGTLRGGNGGTISISNSFGNSSSVSANGGQATVCGHGGNGGTVSLVNSAYGTVSTDPGADQNTIGPSLCIAAAAGGSGGTTGTHTTAGVYVPYIPPAPARTATAPVQHQGSSPVDPVFLQGLLQGIRIPVNLPPKLTLKDIPFFGSGKGSFNLITPITSFVFAPLPDPITRIFKSAPGLQSFMASVGLSSTQDFVRLKVSPLALPATTTTPGVYHVTRAGQSVRAAMTVDSTNTLTESISVEVGQSIKVSVLPLKKNVTSGIFNGKNVTFTPDTNGELAVTLTMPTKPGRYYLTSSIGAFPLTVDVRVHTTEQASSATTRTSVWSKIGKWFTSIVSR
ncbi:MAG: hypothetical protein PHG25_04060 [Candidatus Pacebacteria bacterium]|nr:hypothetical protein [Candidatus Paceibacterota bacterium]